MLWQSSRGECYTNVLPRLVCVCNVFSSEINSTELEARNPLTPLRGGYAGYQNL